ncbi:MAG TPA: LON peptidase substrate-binding domain-containing protein, partial [Pyrinomonadaceae bacterium]
MSEQPNTPETTVEPPASETKSDTPGQETTPQRFEIPVLALQNTTLFPETVVPLSVGRPRSVGAVETALSTPEKLLGCITVKPEIQSATGDARPTDLYEIGTLVIIKRMERVEDTLHIIVQGTERIRGTDWKQEEPYLRAVVEILPAPVTIDQEEVEATKRNVQAMIQQALALLPGVPPEVRVAILGS